MLLYSHPRLRAALAFRGGTALNKLFFSPATRYSEDIDFVQVFQAPIGSIIDDIRELLDSWLGEPRREFSDGRVCLTYRRTSSEGFPIKLKVEINSREHFSVLGLHEYPFVFSTSWEKSMVQIRSYKLEELLGTKMRALYQRRKGRDLFDLYTALTRISNLNHGDIIHCFSEYMKFGGHSISKTLFLENMEEKMKNKLFLEDMKPLLPKFGESFNLEAAYSSVKSHLLDHM